jgi:hypothetical protein
MTTETTMADIDAEFKRIGVDRADTGGMARGPGTSLADVRDWLRTIPDGAGYDGFLSRLREGRELSDEQLLARGREDIVDDIRHMLGWRMHAVTWAERARYLRLVAAEIAKTQVSPRALRSVCHFCGGRPEGYALGEGRGGATICVECAESYAYTLRHSGPGESPSPAT